MKNKVEIIAFYLPQFHPFKENDEWWGKGFTEWTNVGKAKPLFKDHNQPRVPTELGYYDLRLPIVREQQADMARDAGVTAFCYWHYWFGDGKRLIADIFDDVLNSGNPNFPFCLGWANHSWYAKNWNKEGSTILNKTLIEQTYPGKKDMELHFNYLAKAFKDDRYVKIDGKPFFYIFDPVSIPEEYIRFINSRAIEIGFNDGLFLVANVASTCPLTKQQLLDKGFNAVNYQRLGGLSQQKVMKQNAQLVKIKNLCKKLFSLINRKPPFAKDYNSYRNILIDKDEDKCEDVIPSLVPQWDHTPRSGWNGTLFTNATPEVFAKHVIDALEVIKDKPANRQILMLKSWNEWGEGNFMEPDLTYGRGFIEALKDSLKKYNYT